MSQAKLDQHDEFSSIEKLARREPRTNDDGTVEVEIFDWEESEGTVVVKFLTPTNDLKEERMPFPLAGGHLDQYKFYRILQECGLSVRNADLLEGEMVNATVKKQGQRDEEWEISCEEDGPPAWKTALDVLQEFPLFEGAVALLWILILCIIAASLLVLLL